ncbi:MAG: alpha-hydroxy-acid oxidizing protein [Tissierellia bacterium]|nr:alpha-hydroxy-acid oxidizing protein [Tissierellia bacterium]
MNLKDIRDTARSINGFTCRVCPECNGKICKGEVPGIGGKGTGMSFIRNYESLQSYKLNMDLIYEEGEISTETEILGIKLRAPIMAAPIGGLKACFGDHLTDYEYTSAIVKGCAEGGLIGWTGDGISLDFFTEPLRAVNDINGFGIPTIKPWPLDEMQTRLELAIKSNTPAIAMDIDAAGLPFISASGKKLGPKSTSELRKIVSQLRVPFIVKGIMTVESAIAAKEAGASGIVVSNHGGRVLDLTPSTIEVLPEIADAVGKDMTIIVDGGFRTGAHIATALALGADAVLIGRPMAVAAYGAGAEGVKVYIDNLVNDFKNTMLMTGCKKVSEISRKILRKSK